MKNLARKLSLSSLALVIASVAYGASVPPVDVTISDPTGKLAFKGKTNSAGTFATKPLGEGQYIVQFNSANAGKGPYALIISAGKQKVTADSVDGGMFAKGGVAMKVKVGKGLNITGQITTGLAGNTGGNDKVKIVNGKRYIWVKSSTGSNLGGSWEEEGTANARNTIQVDAKGVGAMQEGGSQGSTQ